MVLRYPLGLTLLDGLKFAREHCFRRELPSQRGTPLLAHTLSFRPVTSTAIAFFFGSNIVAGDSAAARIATTALFQTAARAASSVRHVS
jgi:hypothetical protein